MRPALAIALGCVLGAVLLAVALHQVQPGAALPETSTTSTGELEADQDTGALAFWWSLWGDATETLMPIEQDVAERNVNAFLWTIRAAEGTADDNGYRALFGHTPARPVLFDSYADHPRIAKRFTDQAGRTLWTTAAGAYQFMAVSPLPGGGATRVNTWDRIAAKLGLTDFGPAAQDAAAVELIREAGALGDVRAGRFDAALGRVRGVWASLPGAGYAQRERALDDLRTAYVQAGGTFA